MLPSVFPRLATDSAGRVFPGVWKPLFLKFPSWDRAPSPPPLSLFSSFIFFPTCFWRQWSAFLVAWCPLPAYRSCFVEFVQRWTVLLRNLWGRKWSSHPIPLPSVPPSSCPTLCNPRDGSPPGSPVPGILQAITLEWVTISFSNAWTWKLKGKSLSRVRPLAWTADYQAPPSIVFSRQEYWSGVPLPSPLVFLR